MDQDNKKVIMDVISGSITNENSEDKAILFGVYPFEGSNYADKLELVLNRENDIPITITFPYSGYDMQLFVGDFTRDKRDDIMVRGSYGGSGGFEIGVIYRYDDGKLIEIFNQEKYEENNTCSAKYKDNYKVLINCGNKRYLIDISSRPKDYLNIIYDDNKKVKYLIEPYVDAPNGIFPIKQVFNDYNNLLIQQRIVGEVNADTLGVIQTLVDLHNNNFNTIYKGLLSFPYEDVKKIENEKRMKVRKRRHILEGSKIITTSLLNRNEIYYGNEFTVQRDNLNLIVNSINEDRNTLYVDAYIMNLKSYEINQINNFNLVLKDSKGRVFGRKTFDSIDIGGKINPNEGKRLFLSFFSNEYSLFDIDTNNLTWNFTYDCRS
ncbi:MAG: hypothetical protein RSG52_13830 [Terrisporobacter sp.]|uniref:hypothetical protein n=1 Tax=Terrisporobacter sp. TaxID=1965305 RepID=UPI002FC94446